MKRIVVESIQEFRELRDINEQQVDQVDEGALDFFKGARSLIKQSLAKPEDTGYADKALAAGFARQFGKNPKIKEAIMKWDIGKKIELIKLAAERLKDPKIGSLTLSKDKEGKLVVLGSQLHGGAGHSTTGA